MAYNIPLPAAPGFQSVLDAFMKVNNAESQVGKNALQAKYGEPEAQATNALLQAKAKRENTLANLPFGGQNLPGVAGQIQGLETVRQMFGEQSPQYQQAKQMFDLTNQSTQSRIGYQNALTGSMGQRYLTPTGKGLVEGTRVGNGLAPTGQTWQQAGNPEQLPLPLTPDQLNKLKALQAQGGLAGGDQQLPMPPGQQQEAPGQPPSNGQAMPQGAPGTPDELEDQYNLGRQKTNTDTDTRKRNLFATNIEKTLSQINVDDLTHYAGVKGNLALAAQKAIDATSDITGKKASPEYERYKEALNASEFLASQVRQFYGESIQPSMREKLERLTNPSEWLNSPDTAKNLFNSTKKILGLEMKTYRDALKSPEAYQEQKEAPHAAHMANANEMGYVQVSADTPNGKETWTVPANKVNDALKRGFKVEKNG
jgi:hypothetical protein